MRPLEVRPSSGTANGVFWGLVIVWALVSLSFAVLVLFSGLAPAVWIRACTMWVRALPNVARAVVTPLALLGLVSGVLAVSTLVAQIVRTRRFIRDLSRHHGEVPRNLAILAEALGMHGRVDVVDDDRPYAFTYGWQYPRIAVSRALLETLEPSELQAVLLHELYHVRQHGPARLALVRAMARGLFFLPVITDLARGYAALEELAADEFAMRRLGDRWALASALVKVGRGQRPPTGLVLAQAADSVTPLSLRARQILMHPRPVRVPLARSAPAALWSLVVAVLLVSSAVVLAGQSVDAARMGACPLLTCYL
ncbi:M56 family metallopeptidase [Thermaerobacter sp. PB12/4term]|uniref:M56 family metallopeptidase n=1 Tax=Thermaerobacter sp. PB12/4term TaxID=2293838 RepID=UPI001313EF9D|nr:M56 family metallopeptidase [Thermaerobacter sp. PB12/4term]QIA27451.1 M56 family metallopeptidase [Thermaerobacter sp. PB12/4term]